MSAGIKFYTAQGSLMIDGSYSNIAMTDRVQKTHSQRDGLVEGSAIFSHSIDSREPIIVLPLNANACGIYSTVWDNSTSKLKAIFMTEGTAGIDFVIFDKAAKKNTSGPALRIYSDITGDKVFDSRLKYMKVIGEAVDGMAVPVGAKWGVLVRERQLETQVVYTRPGSDAGYLFSFLTGWRIRDNKIQTATVMIRAQYYPSLSAAVVPPADKPKGVKPLLVDLKNY